MSASTNYQATPSACGCKIVEISGPHDLSIYWCKMHGASWLLLDACRRAFADFGPDYKGPTIDALRTAISAAS